MKTAHRMALNFYPKQSSFPPKKIPRHGKWRGILAFVGIKKSSQSQRFVKISGHHQKWLRPFPGAILIPPALLVVADFLSDFCNLWGELLRRSLFFVVFFHLFKIRINNVFLRGCTAAGLIRRPFGSCLLLAC